MKDVMEDNENQTLVSEEDNPLPSQPVQVVSNMGRGDRKHQDCHQNLVDYEPD